MSGQIQVMTPDLAAAIGFAQQKRLRALAVTSRERSAKLPEVPTVAETTPGFENRGWFGLMASAGTPRAIADKLHQDSVKALQEPDIRARKLQAE